MPAPLLYIVQAKYGVMWGAVKDQQCEKAYEGVVRENHSSVESRNKVVVVMFPDALEVSAP
jgi:hypothetical protein